MRLRHPFGTAVLVTGLFSCSPASSPEPAGPNVLARYDGGAVTLQELDDAQLANPGRWSRRPGSSAEEHVALVLREIVLDRLLVEEAEREGISGDPELLRQQEQRRTEVLRRECFQERQVSFEEPTEADARALYESRRDRFELPERRIAYHLFLRRQPGAALEPLKEKAQQLRERVVRGQSFALLAEEHSDSESRHQQGFLGVLAPGRLPPELDRVLFGLGEMQVSEPVGSGEGVHLFYVQRILPARTLSFEEVRALSFDQIRTERQRAALAEMTEPLELPPDAFVPGRDDLARLLRSGDPTATVLRIGDFTLDVAGLKAQLSQVPEDSRWFHDEPPGVELLEVLKNRHLLFRDCLDSGLLELPKVQRLLKRADEVVLMEFQRKRQTQRLLDQDPELLRRHYEQNRLRFTSLLELHLQRLRVPLSENGNEVMGRMETARKELDSGALAWEALATELGGWIDDLGLRSLEDVLRMEPKLNLVASLQSGETVAPFVRGAFLEMYRVQARQDPEPLPFESVRERVKEDYLENRGQELYQRFVDSLLNRHDFQVLSERLDRLPSLRLEEIEGTAAPSPP